MNMKNKSVQDKPLNAHALTQWREFMALDTHTRFLRLAWVSNSRAEATVLWAMCEHHRQAGGFGDQFHIRMSSPTLERKLVPHFGINYRSTNAAIQRLIAEGMLIKCRGYENTKSRRVYLNWPAISERLNAVKWGDLTEILPFQLIADTQFELAVLLTADQHGQEMIRASAGSVVDQWAHVLPGLYERNVSVAMKSLHKRGYIDMAAIGKTANLGYRFRLNAVVHQTIRKFLETDLIAVLAESPRGVDYE